MHINTYIEKVIETPNQPKKSQIKVCLVLQK
jgi:hypothetical protein